MGVAGDGLFYIFVYLPIYFLFTLIQRIYWLCNGMRDIINQIEAGQLYERSAHVYDIRWKVKKEAFQLLNRKNFIATHRSFEHPNYILKHNVSLLCTQLDMAIFVETPEDYDVFDCRQSPFIHIGQFDRATKLITMPISSLHTVANDIGDPKSRIIWIHSTGRCGSTAVGQVFEVVPSCTVISEPMTMFTLRMQACNSMNENNYRNFLLSERYTEALRSIVRVMAKPNQHKPAVMVIKNFTLCGVNEVPILEKLFPSHTHIFLYRDCLPTVKSYLRSLKSHFWMNFVLALRRNACLRFVIRSPSLFIKALADPEVVDGNLWMYETNLQLNITDFGLLVLQWATLCKRYVDLFESKKTKTRALRYEDIIEKKEATLALLFDFCDIPLDYIEAAKKSLESDSQEGTVLSRKMLNKIKTAQITEHLQNEGDLYLRCFNLPTLGKPAFLPGVLSPYVVNLTSLNHNVEAFKCTVPGVDNSGNHPHVVIEIQA